VSDGHTAIIYRIKKKDSNKDYAAKILRIPTFMMDTESQCSNETELAILKKCNHPFIIKFIEEFQY
jgi:hypothetical protein